MFQFSSFSFDKYTLVNHVKQKLKSNLKDMVKAEVQLQCRDTQLTPEKMKMVAPAILSKLLTSDAMEETVGSLRSEVSSAASEMSVNFDRELVLMSQIRDNRSSQRPPLLRNDSGLNDSLSSTWNQSTFIFLQPSQYFKLAEKLNPYGPAEGRIEALNTLLVTQIGEVVSSQAWPSLREGLQTALIDSNTNVNHLAMKIHARLLANVSPYCTKEAFVSITTAVIAFYKDKTRSHMLPMLATEVSFKKKPNHMLLQLVRLITSVCKDLPKYWARYPEAYTENIMKAMIDLVSLKSGGGRNNKVLSPIHLISLVDPKANWLKAWLHGNLGRKTFFAIMSRTNNNLLIKTSLHHVLVILEKGHFPLLSRSSGRKKGLVSSSLVSFAFFSHNLNIVLLALSSSRGQAVFPVNLPLRDDSLDGPTVIKILVSFVASSHQVSHKSTSNVMTRALVTLASSDATVKKFFANDAVVNALVVPVINWHHHTQSQLTGNVLQLFAQIFNSPSGMAFCQQVKIENGDEGLAEYLLKFTMQFFTNYSAMSPQNEELLTHALNMCKPIVESHANCLSSAFDRFVKATAETYFDIDDMFSVTPTNSSANLSHNFRTRDVKAKLAEVLVSCAKSPRGIYALAKTASDGFLQKLIEDKTLEVDNILLAAFHPGGRFTLDEVNYVQEATKKLVDVLDEQEADKQWDPSLDSHADKISGITANLVTVLSDMETFKHTANAGDSLGLLLPIDSYSPMSLGHDIALPLKMLTYLSADLDTWAILIVDFKIKNVLTDLLVSSKTEDGTEIVDEGLSYVKFLSARFEAIGGPAECNLPSIVGRETKSTSVKNSREANASELRKFLQEAKKQVSGARSLERRGQIRQLFRTILVGSNGVLSSSLISQLLATALDLASTSSMEANFVASRPLSSYETLTIDAMAKYRDVEPKSLTAMLRSSKSLLETAEDDSHVDWFALVVGVLVEADVKLGQAVLEKCKHDNAVLRWPSLGSDEASIAMLGHYLEMILNAECPLLRQSLTEHNIQPAVIARRWTKQMFLNFLDWPEICNYVLIMALYGEDYQVYFCIAVFRYLRDQVVGLAHDDLMLTLMASATQGFSAGDYLPYMEQLEAKYRNLLISDIKRQSHNSAL